MTAPATDRGRCLIQRYKKWRTCEVKIKSNCTIHLGLRHQRYFDLKRAYIFVNKLLLRLVIASAILSPLYLVLLFFFGWGNKTIIYWLALYGADVFVFGPILFLGSSLYLVLTLVLFRDPVDKGVRNNAALMVFMSVIATIFLFGTVVVVGLIQTGPFGDREQISDLYLNRYGYHLQLYSSDPAEGWNNYYYELYECRFDVFCEEVYAVFQDNGIDPKVETIELLADVPRGDLRVQINGVVAFTRNPELGICSINQGFSDYCRKPS